MKQVNKGKIGQVKNRIKDQTKSVKNIKIELEGVDNSRKNMPVLKASTSKNMLSNNMYKGQWNVKASRNYNQSLEGSKKGSKKKIPVFKTSESGKDRLPQIAKVTVEDP